MKLLFIHGRAQEGKDPVALQESWDEALDKGFAAANLARPDGLEVGFPFYGDRLDELIEQLDAPLVEDVATKGAPADSDEAAFRAELFEEMAAESGITEAEIQAHFAGEPQEKGPLNWEWVQAILKALERTPFGERAIDRFTRDVYVYLTNRVVRREIDRIVEDAIGSGPSVVVGHSLGSVVGYNVLRAQPSAVAVTKYVTVGSPLGLASIKRRLEAPLTMPNCVESWYNAMDERDVVALHPLNQHHFAITPAIENKTTVRNHTDNRHGIIGYLDDTDVARVIHAALSAL